MNEALHITQIEKQQQQSNCKMELTNTNSQTNQANQKTDMCACVYKSVCARESYAVNKVLHVDAWNRRIIIVDDKEMRFVFSVASIQYSIHR